MVANLDMDIKPYVVGHLGLVGTFIQESGIIEMIDSRIPKTSNNHGHLTHGQVVALMILNGLGYTTRPLYMSNTFFDAKDVEAMLGIEYDASWFNDDVIGRTMDALYEYGLTPLFSDRDGKIYDDVSEISKERRTGYDWYGTWPLQLHLYKSEDDYYNKQ